MRTLLVIALVLIAIPAFAQLEPLCTAIPVERERDIQLATYATAAVILDESEATAHHTQRLALAQLVVNSPGEVWRQIADYTQAQVATCIVNWSSLTYAQLKSNVSANWTDIAILRFGPDVVIEP